MPNLRIVYDNALDRATSFTATNTNASYPASNMQNDDKSSTWRTTGALSTNVQATWATPEPIGAVIFPICNFTSAAGGRVIISTEMTATNVCLWSEQFDNAAWTKAGGTIAANTVGAPDSSGTADRLTATNNDGYLVQNIGGIAAGTPYVASVWLKSTANRNINLFLGSGTVTVAVTTAWQRFYVNCAPTSSGVLAFQISGGGALQTGGILDLWGAQLEQGLAPSSYYPTSSAAAIRPTGYIDPRWSYQYDSGDFFLCPAQPIKPRGFTAAQSLIAYAYSGGACGRFWLPAEMQATGIRVFVADPNNPLGYLDIAKAVFGPYWSPTYNASAASLTFVDTTAIDRTDAGGQIADAGNVYKRVPIDLSMMPAADRTTCAKILRNSRAYPIFLSLFPGDADLELERDNSVYGRRTTDSDLNIENSIYYGTKIAVEEI